MGKKPMDKKYNRNRIPQRHPNSRLLLELGTGIIVFAMIGAALLGIF
jgi:hypothetical protein